MRKEEASIGIFDSGIGGLTVVKAVQKVMPNENIVYFGDTARVPYGSKSAETVRGFGLQITDFLIQQEVKMILIACNTVSASARNEIQQAASDIPVIDVISAGAKAALQYPEHKKIGVIGTLATIASKAYERAIQNGNREAEVISEACPLLVPLAEEGWTNNNIARQIVHKYLQKFSAHQINSLILGCTHYPLFKTLIEQELHKPETKIIDSGISIAQLAQSKLEELHLCNTESSGTGFFNCFVSDRPQHFQELAGRFLGKPLNEVQFTQLT